MTNEEAIKILKQSKLCTNMICGDPLEICRYSKDVEEAVEKAIEALELADDSCDGCIFEDNPCYQFPCSQCKRNCNDCYARSECDD